MKQTTSIKCGSCGSTDDYIGGDEIKLATVVLCNEEGRKIETVDEAWARCKKCGQMMLIIEAFTVGEIRGK